MTASGRKKGSADLLVAALAAGKTVREAATICGVAERTIRRRMSDPAFAARVAEAQRLTSQAALGRLVESLTAAADTLAELLKAESDSVKLGAARSIVEMTAKIKADVEFAEQLRQLREELDAVRRQPR